ncbi:hypothetical protein FACS189496_1840 [Bacilli bacterium]|nr:hypothetical protein FACS189496_1840 [Bacilli bacterium]
MSEKIRNREIEKYYIAKIHGIINPKSGILNAFLTKKPNENLVTISKNSINSDSQPIITEYKTISHNNIDSYIEIYLRTGKTHQIRAHMNFINHPLFGEKKYCNPNYKDNEKFQNLTSYKVFFNFKTDAGILQYLNGKAFYINAKKDFN